MKTNQIMTRSDGFTQRTVDGYFNANNLLTHWGKKNVGAKLQMGNFKRNSSTVSFIALLKSEGITNPMITGRGVDGGTWMHPKLFIDFAMWVSVEFKSKVIDMVLDGLIQGRNDAGDYYNQMSAVILETHVNYYGCKPTPLIYIKESKMIKKMAGVNGKNRNEMTEKELSNITSLQKYNAVLLKDNIGKSSRINRLELFSKSFLL